MLVPRLTKPKALNYARFGSVLAILPTLGWCTVGTNVPAMLALQVARSSLGAVVNISLSTLLSRSGNGAQTLRNFAALQFAVGAVEGTAGVIGPFLPQRFGVWVFVIDAGSFALFCFLVAFVKPRDIADDQGVPFLKKPKPALEFSDARRYAVSHRRLFAVVIAFAAIYFCWAVNSAVGYPILREWGSPREYRSYFKLAATLGGLLATWRMLCPTGEDAPGRGLPSPLALGSTVALLGAVTIVMGFVPSGIAGILLQFPQGFVSDAASVMVKAFIAHECGPQMVGLVNGLAGQRSGLRAEHDGAELRALARGRDCGSVLCPSGPGHRWREHHCAAVGCCSGGCLATTAQKTAALTRSSTPAVPDHEPRFRRGSWFLFCLEKRCPDSRPIGGFLSRTPSRTRFMIRVRDGVLRFCLPHT